MGLSERRRIKQLLEEQVPEFAAKFHRETGLAIPVVVDAESLSTLSDLGQLNNFLDWLSGSTNYGEFWTEAISAWKQAAADALGRQVIAQTISSWTIRYEPGVGKGLQLRNGVLVQQLGDGLSEYPRLYLQDFFTALDALLVSGGLPLSERRRVEYLQNTVLPQRQAELKAATGSDIELSLVDNFAQMPAGDPRGGTLDWVTGYTNSGEFWNELVAALRAICSDELGQKALTTAVQRIEVRWESRVGADLRLAGGTLTYLYNFADCPSDGSYRLFADDIRQRLEALL